MIEPLKKVMIIGSGGREDALRWKLTQSPLVKKIIVTPGNANTSESKENPKIDVTDIKKLSTYAKENDIGLTIVGPEVPLALGITDYFQERGLPIFGPTQVASQLETSKAFASKFMNRHSIPSPAFHVSRNIRDALAFIENPSWQKYVIKADGLAAGKGVVLPENKNEARITVIQMMEKHVFKEAGDTVIFQERLTGQEVSLIVFTDGKTVVPLLPAQDHKRIHDHDKGPNTGGMGAYAPAPVMTPELLQEAQEKILQPTIEGMAFEGHPYQGVLYAGLMLTKKGLQVLEYNVRFGDPETQPLMTLLQSDLATILLSCIKGTLEPEQVTFKKGSAVCVVLAAEGYPGQSKSGEIIYGLDKIKDPQIQIFHAGTLLKDGQIVTHGGRILGVTAYDDTIQKAIFRAYSVIGKKGVYFENMQYRKDIGLKAINKKYAV